MAKSKTKKAGLKTESPNRCSVTGNLRKNIFTAHIDYGDGELIVPLSDINEALRDYAIPHTSDLNTERPDEDGTLQEITIKIKKVMTADEVDALPEMY